MLAIKTNYVKATEKRGSRVSAVCGRFRVLIGWNCELSEEGNHLHAARLVAQKMALATGTTGHDWKGGEAGNGNYIFISGATKTFIG